MTVGNRGLGNGDSCEKVMLPQGKRYLLVIAISKYDKAKTGYDRLEFPVTEAKEFVTLMNDQYGFKETITLFNEQCTQKDITKAIATLRDTVRKEDEKRALENGNQPVTNTDELVVLFSGHGASDRDRGYWVTYDGDPVVELNWSVLDVLDRLNGICSQVLLIADCCFAGTLSEKAYDKGVFSGRDYKGSKFSIITSGNKFSEVPDKSVFMQTLMEVLSSNDVTSFEKLVDDMQFALKLKRIDPLLTPYTTPEQIPKPFLLQRLDKVSYQLTESFFYMNYKDQFFTSAGARLFNMTYVRGTKHCGHHIFTRRYFMDLEKNNTLSMFNYRKYTTSFIGDSKGSDYSIWNEIAKIFGIKTVPVNIIERLLLEVEATNWLLVIKVDECDEATLEEALKDFWKRITEYVAANQKTMKSYTNSIYVFIWDRRGLGDGISDIVTKDKFKDLPQPLFTKLLPLNPIKNVDTKNDIEDWYFEARKYNEVMKDAGFAGLDPANLDLEEPYTVQNVIAQITDKCGHENVYNNLFCNNKFWIS